MERENRNLKVLVVILCILVLGLGCYFFYDKVLNDDSNANYVNDTNVNDTSIKEEYDANQYIVLEELVFNSKVSTKKVKLQNLDDSITKEFYSLQDDVINSIHVSDDEMFNAEYKLRHYINNNILSILYTIEESNAIGTCATKMAVINIDLANNKIVSEGELLKKAGLSYESLADIQYEERLASWKETNEFNGFETDYYEVTFADFRDNKSKYVNLALEKLPDIIYTYIENGQIKYDYYSINLASLFHPVGKGGCFRWETITLGEF